MSEQAIDTAERPRGLARARQGVLGSPLPRIEGPLKVTGAAAYAYEQAPEGTLHAAIVGAPVAAGRVTRIDATHAEALDGVVAAAEDIDLCMILGAGWPFQMGGVTPFLDRVGASERAFGGSFHTPQIRGIENR